MTSMTTDPLAAPASTTHGGSPASPSVSVTGGVPGTPRKGSVLRAGASPGASISITLRELFAVASGPACLLMRGTCFLGWGSVCGEGVWRVTCCDEEPTTADKRAFARELVFDLSFVGEI